MSLPEAELTMHRLRPHWGHVTVLDSPVDEEQRASGLIVPLGNPGNENNQGLRRGIVLHCSDYDHYGQQYASDDGHDLLAPGTVVYFRQAHQVGDVLVVDRRDVLAYLGEDE